MNFNPLERRRAEAFARQLDFDGPAHPHHQSRSARTSGTAIEDELAELLEVTDRLHELGGQAMAASRPSDHWRDATRRRLMAVAEDEGIGATARHRASASVPETERAPVLDDLFPQRPRGGRRLAIVAALLTGTVAVSGVSTASGDALPGETLYNVKRSTEKAQLALAGTDLGRAQLHLEFARTRIDEARAVAGDDEAVQRALEDAATELRSGVSLLGELAVESGDPTALDYVDLFTNEHRGSLVELVGAFEGDSQAAGDDLLALFEAAALRSVELRGALECTSPGGPADELGPVPGECGGGEDVDRPDGAGRGNGDAVAEETESEPEPESESVPESGEESEPDQSDPGLEAEEPTGGSTSDSTGDPTAEPQDGADTYSGEDEKEQPEDESGNHLDELSGIVSDLFD